MSETFASLVRGNSDEIGFRISRGIRRLIVERTPISRKPPPGKLEQ
jgi:hypothetical protein